MRPGKEGRNPEECDLKAESRKRKTISLRLTLTCQGGELQECVKNWQRQFLAAFPFWNLSGSLLFSLKGFSRSFVCSPSHLVDSVNFSP